MRPFGPLHHALGRISMLWRCRNLLCVGKRRMPGLGGDRRGSMHKGVIAVTAIGAAAAVVSTGFVLGTASLGGCPTALLEGTLVKENGTLAVQPKPPAPAMSVAWPIGYGVRDDHGTLVLTRFLVVDVAREGDKVSVGGGMSADDSTFQGCGPIVNGLLIPEG